MSTNKERLIKNNQDLNNIKTQVHNLPEYLDTSDATATENDLLQGKTAYVNGKKLVGIYEGSSGSGEVKKFDTIEDMQQDKNPQEGDLAVVYSNQQSNITENSVFSKITLPQTVVLDTAVEDYIEIGFNPVDESVEMECFGNLDSNRMNVDIYMMSVGTDYRISYESQDGITYIRSGETPEEIDFGFDVKFGNRYVEVNWDDRIGQFFIIGQANFNGLYYYGMYTSTDYKAFDLSQVTVENSDIIVPEIDVRVSYERIVALYNYIKNKADYPILANAITITMDSTGNLYGYHNALADTKGVYTGSKEIICNVELHTIYIPSINYSRQSILPDGITKYKYDINTGTIMQIEVDSVYNELLGVYIIDISNEPYFLGGELYIENDKLNQMSATIVQVCDSNGYIKGLNEKYMEKVPSAYSYMKYNIAPTQLSAKTFEVCQGQFYGNNGVEEGILLNTLNPNTVAIGLNIWKQYNNGIILPEDASKLFYNYKDATLPDIKCTSNTNNINNLFAMCENLTSLNVSNWDVSNVSNMASIFSGCRKLTQLNIDNWNTSNATNMGGIFLTCLNLTSLNVSNWDVSNVREMQSMFSYCINVMNLDVSNWDTSNVFTASSLFYNCKNLKSLNVSNWNTSNVKSMSAMFENCASLNQIDVSNWDVSNVTEIVQPFTTNSIFSRCKNLQSINVSNWNLSKVTNISGMFSYCNNLSNASIDSIINMCINAVNVTNKSLIDTYQGSSPFSATNITNTRYQNRWAELTAAGWKY